MSKMNVMRIAPLLAALVGCSSATWPAKGPVAAKTAGIDRKVVSKERLAELLNDNPTAVARRAKDGPNDTAIAKGPSVTGGGSNADADAAPIMKKAVEALENKDYANAEKYAKEVIAIDDKGYPYAFVILGDVALESSKDYDKALENYKHAMELDPKDGWAAQRTAHAYVKLKKPLEARATLRKFTTENPDTDADTWDALAWMEMEQGDWKRAEHAFNEALRVSDGKDAEAWYGLSLIYARRQDAKGVEKALNALFALQPDRRLVIERDPTFFRMRLHPSIAALFSPKLMADAKVAAEKKKKGEPVASIGTKLTVPGGGEKSFTEQIHFDFDSAKIKPESKQLLDDVAGFLKDQKNLEFVEITGHADRRGDEKYNITLSESRAAAVRSALIMRGVSASLLKTKGYGVYCPLDDGDDESAFAKNRRVQFAISASGKLLGDELTCQERMRKWLKPEGVAKIKKAMTPTAPQP
jgi:outer membrane protein OmpA-like peptidoglycan-associated protein